MRSALKIEDISLGIASGVACALSQVVSDGILHLRPFSVTEDGRLSISDAPRIPRSAVPANKMRFEVGDILFNNTNSVELVGKSAVFSTALDASFSNHMTRIRIDRQQAEPGYVQAFLRHLYSRHFFHDRSTRWVSQAAFGTAQLKALEVPLPPLDEQRRIVGLLDRAAEIRRRVDAARAKARAIIPALFLDTFGDPATNPKGWQTVTLDDLCDLVRGSSPRPQGDPRFFGGPVPRLMISDITRDGTYVTPRIDSLTVEGAARSRPMKSGNVVMAVSGAVGLPAILAIDACIHDGFVGFRNLHTQVTEQFLYYYLLTVRKSSQGQAIGATFQNLNTDQIRRWAVPIPPKKNQVRFAAAAQRFTAIACHLEAAANKATAVVAGLSNEAFGDAATSARRNAA